MVSAETFPPFFIVSTLLLISLDSSWLSWHYGLFISK